MTNRETDDICALQTTIYNSSNPVRKWLHCSRRDAVLNIIEQTCSLNDESELAIEVGPGSGVYLPMLCQKFKEVTALDIEISHLKNIAHLQDSYANLSLVHGDITDHKNICEPKYDLVLCSEVIEHINQPEEFVASLSDNVKLGGYLILTTPQPYSLMELTCKVGLSSALIPIVRMLYREPVLPTGHINLMSQRRVIDLLVQNKLRIVGQHVLGLYIPLLAEFGGQRAVNVCKFLEKWMAKIGVSWPLWTQIYVAIKE